MRFVTGLALVVAASIAAAGCGGGGGGGGHRDPGPSGSWERLGVRTVDHRGDHDTIMAGLQGTFRAIKIEVNRSELEMFNIRVNFENGEHWSPDTRVQFREGSWSRTIDLPGAQRRIKSVDFWYKTQHRGEGKAVVEVWGLH